MDSLLQWFKSHNGIVDEQHMGLTQLEGCGGGAIALRDIPVRALFSSSTLANVH
jgi:hypothetical protein